MRQFSIKNEAAGRLLEEITQATGEGKTEAVLHALQVYRDSILGGHEVRTTIDEIRAKVHPKIQPRYLGKVPAKDEIEAELGMP